MSHKLDFVYQLESLLQSRKKEMPENSYTGKLFREGKDRILKKIAEEAGEVIIASKNGARDEMVYESADLVFHLMLALVEMNISIEDIVQELEKRHQ